MSGKVDRSEFQRRHSLPSPGSVALWTLGLLMSVVAPASAQLALDQEAANSDPDSGLFGLGTLSRAQTFTVGIAGTLGIVEIKVSGGATTTLEIQPTAGGLPVFGSAALGSATASFVGTSAESAYAPFDFSTAGIQVEAGDVLAIVNPGGTTIQTGTTPFWHRIRSTVQYPGGTSYATSGSSPAAYAPSGGDLGFRTYVDPKPPVPDALDFDPNDRSNRTILLYPESTSCPTLGAPAFASPDCTVFAEDEAGDFAFSPIPAQLTWSGDTATLTVSAAAMESYLSSHLGTTPTFATEMVLQFDVVTGAIVGGQLGGGSSDFFFQAGLPTLQGPLTFDWLNRSQSDRPFEGTVLAGTAFERQVIASCATADDAPTPVDTNGSCFLQRIPAPAYNFTFSTLTVLAQKDAVVPLEDYSPEFESLDFALAELSSATPVPSFAPGSLLVLLLAMAGLGVPAARRTSQREPTPPISPAATASSILFSSATILLLVSTLIIFVSSPRNAHAESFEGVLELGIAETFERNSEAPSVRWHQTLRTETGRISLSEPLSSDAPNLPPSIAHNTRVRIEGDLVEGRIEAGSIIALDEAALLNQSSAGGVSALRSAAAPPSDTVGQQNTLVTLLNFTNDLSQSHTPAEVTAALLDESEPTSTASYIREASYDRAWLSGGVAGWIQTGYSDASCLLWSSSPSGGAAQLIETLDPLIDFSAWDRWIIVIPNNTSCGFSGFSTLGKETWETEDGTVRFSRFVLNGFNVSTFPAIAAHELGHSMGALQHSLDYECGTDVVDDRCPPGPALTDRYDVIAASIDYGHFSAPNKEALHWFDGDLVDVAPPGGTFFIEPYATQNAGIKALRLPVSWVINDLQGTSGYYVTYRTPVGFDAIYPELANDGAMIHLDGDFFTPREPPVTGSTRLLDLSPNAGAGSAQTLDSEDVTLAIGQTFSDVENGISVEVKGVSGGALEVEVLYTKYCGNGVADPAIGEACDGADLAGATCQSIGRTSGSLSCDTSCQLDTLSCAEARCGPGHEYNALVQTCTADFPLDPAARGLWTSTGGGPFWSLLRERAFASNFSDEYGYLFLNISSSDTFTNIYRVSIPFDTASIPDGVDVLSASLEMKLLEANFPTFNTHPESADQLVLVEATLANPPEVALTDYPTIGSLNNPIEGAPRVDLGDIMTGDDVPFQFDLNANGLAMINPSGYSLFGLRSAYDVDDIEIPGVLNRISVYFRSEESPVAGPRLRVTYEALPEPGTGLGLIVGCLALVAGSRRQRS